MLKMNKKKQNPGTWLKVAIIVIVVVLILGILMVITRPSERPAKPENNQTQEPRKQGYSYGFEEIPVNLTINTELPFKEGQEYVYKAKSSTSDVMSSFNVAGIREINGTKYYAIMADAWGKIYFEPDDVWETFEKLEHPVESIFYNIETGEVCERNPPIGGDRLIKCGFFRENVGLPLYPWMLAIGDNVSLGKRINVNENGHVSSLGLVTYKVVGRETLRGRDCFKVVANDAAFWVDAETRIMVGWVMYKDNGEISSEEILIKAPFPLTE